MREAAMRKSREAAEDCSPRRKPWVVVNHNKAPKGRPKLLPMQQEISFAPLGLLPFS